jgi:hypothetical protein
MLLAVTGTGWASVGFCFAKIARPANGAYALAAPFFRKAYVNAEWSSQ